MGIVGITLATIPGILLMYMVYKLDTVEKEPLSLIMGLVIAGAVTYVPVYFIEYGYRILACKIDTGLMGIILFGIGAAVLEECIRFVVLRIITWKSPEFDYLFDGIVYSVSISVGFALCRNVIHAFVNGTAGMMTEITVIPTYAIIGVFMGVYYGQAKKYAMNWDDKEYKFATVKALLVPIFIHMIYVTLKAINGPVTLVIFIALVVALDTIAILKLIKISKHDEALAKEQTNWTEEKE